MKHWIRKALLGLSLITALSVLAACGSAEKTDEIVMDPQEKTMVESAAQGYMEYIGGLSKEEIEKTLEQAEKQKDEVLFNGLTNYENSMDRLGAFVSVDSAEATKTKKGYTVEIASGFEKRQLNLTLGLSENMDAITEMTFEPVYTMAEQLADAGGNLLIGMGTVFAVLIFIAWIISLFKYIAVFEQKKKSGQAEKKAAAKPAAAPAPARTSPPAAASTASAPQSGSPEELQAVIAAAIAAYEAENVKNGDGFTAGPTLQNGLVVRSIRRR